MNDVRQEFAFGLIIFDCDGTLVDSVGGIAQVVNLTLASLGLVQRFTPAQVGAVVGLSLEKALATLLPEQEPPLWAEAVRVYKEHYRRLGDAGALESPLFPGVWDTLVHLRAAGLQLAVATGKSRLGIDRTLRDQRIGPFFSIVKTGDCAPSKPDPGMVTQALSESGIAPERTLMVGDTDFDVHMGRNAGVRTCAVTFGGHPRARLTMAQPDYIIDRFSDLMHLPGMPAQSGGAGAHS